MTREDLVDRFQEVFPVDVLDRSTAILRIETLDLASDSGEEGALELLQVNHPIWDDGSSVRRHAMSAGVSLEREANSSLAERPSTCPLRIVLEAVAEYHAGSSSARPAVFSCSGAGGHGSFLLNRADAVDLVDDPASVDDPCVLWMVTDQPSQQLSPDIGALIRERPLDNTFNKNNCYLHRRNAAPLREGLDVLLHCSRTKSSSPCCDTIPEGYLPSRKTTCDTELLSFADVDIFANGPFNGITHASPPSWVM